MADIDKDLAKTLQAARKKPRNFAIIVKGPNILKLIVDKRPIKDGALMKAKKECQGNAVVKGTVAGGDGPELVFQVTEEPAVGEVKLRKFITDETKLTLKPRFQVVTELQEIDDESPDEWADERGAETSGAAPAEPAAVVPPPAPPAAPEGEKLADALKALTPLVQKALAAQPGRKAEILAPAAAIKSLLSQGQAAEVREQLLAYAAFLKQLAATTPPGTNGGVSLVALGKARLEWVRVRDAALQDFRRLKDAVREEFADDPEQATQLAAALGVLDQKIAQLDGRLHEELDAVLNAEEAARTPLISRARGTLGDLLGFLNTDPVMAEIDGNEVLPELKVRAPLEAQLNSIAIALG